MRSLPHLMTRVFDAPLCITKPKLEIILATLNDELDLGLASVDLEAAKVEAAKRDRSRPYYVTSDGIAQISIHGTLVRRAGGLDTLSGLRSYAQIENEVLDAATDSQVRGILLDIDSPGGEVAGMFDLVDQVKEAAELKPMYAAANDNAFSAAFLLASAAEKIFVTRTGGTGSVGALAVHLDQSGANEQAGKKYTVVRSGVRKAEHNPLEPLTEDARSSLQSRVDDVRELFISEVVKNRNLTADHVRSTEAQAYYGEQAMEVGFADKIGTLEDAHRALVESLEAKALGIGKPSQDKEEASTDPRGSDTATTTSPEEAEMDPKDGAEVATEELTAEEMETIEQLRREGALEERQRCARIEQLCKAAGRSDLAGRFIDAELEPYQVGEKLLDLRVQEDGVELDTNVGPEETELGLAADAEPTVQEQQTKIDVEDIYSRLRQA